MSDVADQSTTRAPRGLVKLNDEVIYGWSAMEVENNIYASADTFNVRFVVSALPAERDANWFSQQQDMYCELFIGFPSNPNLVAPDQLKSWIYGQVDTIDFDPVTGEIIVAGRDLTRVFIDAKTSEKFQQKTSSQIAQLLAARRGLSAQVTATKTPAGKYYDIDHVNLEDERTEWDILCYLAQSEGFVVYVRGKTLFFGPPPSGDQTPYPLFYNRVLPASSDAVPSANVSSMRFMRALTVSRGITVVVRSWNDKHAHGFNAVYPHKKAMTIAPGQSTTPNSVGQIHYIRRGNLTQQQAEQLAQSTYAQIVKHEMRMEATLPGDNDLDTTSTIRVSGTSTAWDQVYYPESITRRLSMQRGYEMAVHAKNSTPESLEPGL